MMQLSTLKDDETEKEIEDTRIIFQEEIKEDWRHHLYKLNAVENSELLIFCP